MTHYVIHMSFDLPNRMVNETLCELLLMLSEFKGVKTKIENQYECSEAKANGSLNVMKK